MNQAIMEAMRSINAYYGPGTIRTGKELRHDDIFITGVQSLDHATGGIPRGRIVELFGENSSGKSTLARFLAGSAGETLYMDADNSLTDMRGLHVMHPETLEDALRAVEIAAPAFDAIVIDTLTALPTKEEAAADIGDFYQKNKAAVVLSRALPRLVPVLLKNRCTLILVTQLRDIPGVMYGRPDKPSGGRALRHYASLRIETQRIELTKHGGECTGQRIRATVWKNKCGVPFRAAEMQLLFGYGRAVA